ncbi:MAG TPA: diaminopimelate decarboxylase [Gemmatimonadales bacterium]|nr:diaminopimelate decarboxylase [Gemmatimonadales bacterium]
MGQGVLNQARARRTAPEARARLEEEAGLARVGGELHVGGVPLSAIADAAGTPTFVYHADVIRQRYRALDAALAGLPHRICFAVKANSSLAVLALLEQLGAGADIVSGGELQRALRAGFPAGRIVFSGVGKTDEELDLAVRSGVGHIHLESVAELEALGRITERQGRRATVGIRVNPDVTADTHPFIATGQGGIKFGLPADQVAPAIDRIRRSPYLRLTCLAMHIGSQLREPAPYAEGLSKLVALVEKARRAGVTTLDAIDLGGGLGIRYGAEPGMDVVRFAETLRPFLGPLGLTVYLEPGRYLVGPAGVLLTEVLYRKHSGGRDFVVVDAAMNDLLRPSLYQAYHGIVEVEAKGRPVAPVDVVGPVCETGDFLAVGRPLPGVEPGERLAVLGAGAYGFVMSSNYNTRARAAEVLVSDGRWAVVRPRESVDELFKTEAVDPFTPVTVGKPR